MGNAVINAADTQAQMMAALAGAVVDPTEFRQTDAGNALLFVEMYGDDLRYVEAWRSWAHWNGSRWEIVSDTALLPLAWQATEHVFKWAATLPEDQRTPLRKHALATQKEQRLHAMINIAKERQALELNQVSSMPIHGCSDAKA
jgi:D5 N terminal like